jgi:hypothetical protein
MRRHALGALGTVSLAVGVALAAVPGLAPGRGPTLAALVAVVLAGAGLAVPTAGRAVGADSGGLDPGDPGERGAPGAEVDRALATVSARTECDRREELADRLETAAVTELAPEVGGEEAAREALAAGDWTDDDAAAAFFGDAEPGARDRVRELVRGEPAFAWRARRAVDALADLRERRDGD